MKLLPKVLLAILISGIIAVMLGYFLTGKILSTKLTDVYNSMQVKSAKQFKNTLQVHYTDLLKNVKPFALEFEKFIGPVEIDDSIEISIEDFVFSETFVVEWESEEGENEYLSIVDDTVISAKFLEEIDGRWDWLIKHGENLIAGWSIYLFDNGDNLVKVQSLRKIGIGKKIEKEYICRTIKDGRDVTTIAENPLGTDTIQLAFNYMIPLLDQEDKIIGAYEISIAFDKAFKALKKAITISSSVSGGFPYITDKDHNFLIHSNPAVQGRNARKYLSRMLAITDLPEEVVQKSLDEFDKVAKIGKGPYMYYWFAAGETEPQLMYAYGEKFTPLKLSVVYTWAHEDIKYLLTAPVKKFVILVIILPILIIALVLSFLIVIVIQHVRALGNSADQISLGRVDAEIGIMGSDEIGDLSKAMERMRLSVKTAIERLRRR